MKKIILFVAAFCVASTVSVSAQSTDKEETDAMQAIFGKEKKELVSSLIKMTPEEAAKFWPVYDAYEIERKALGQQRMQLLRDMADAYGNMTAEKADAVSEKAIKLSGQTDKLLSNYYKKVKKATNSTIGFEFYQTETYILTEIRGQLMSRIPLYSTVKPKS